MTESVDGAEDNFGPMSVTILPFFISLMCSFSFRINFRYLSIEFLCVFIYERMLLFPHHDESYKIIKLVPDIDY